MTLGAAELLTNGITTTCEQYRHPAPVTQAVLDAGIRAVYTPGIFEVPGSPDGPGQHWEVLLAEACDAVRRDGRAARAASIWASGRTPSTPCRPRVCAPSRPRPQRRDALFQIHLSETAAEGEVVRDRYGMSAPALLADVGALDGRVLAAHAVWLDDDDLALLAEHDVAVAHCPGSNGKLGSGVAPLRRLLERGVRVGLGTDGPASNDDLHLWDEMRLAALLARAIAGDPGAVSTAAALRLATRGGGDGPRPPGRRARGGAAGRPHPPAHRRPALHAVGHRRRAARAPGLGRRRLPGDRRLGRRLVRGRGRPLHAHRRGASAGRGGPARPSIARLVGFLLMPGFVDQAQLHARAGDGGAGRGVVAARGARRPRRPRRRRRRARRRRLARRHRERVVAPRLQGPPLPPRHQRRARVGAEAPRGAGQGHRGAAAGGHRRARAARETWWWTWPPAGTRFLVAEGGQGGRGNARFLSNRRRAPAFAEQGEHGQEHWLDLELKLMADVALVGFPNAGKSTLISTVSAAKPKIADYPFTTLEPHLGVVRLGGAHDGTEFVMADIPGLVEGAAGGRGLGHQFLRHIERARVLVVLLDLGAPLAGGEPAAAQLRVLLAELGAYRPELLERPRARRGQQGRPRGGGRRRRGRGRVRPGALGGDRRRRGDARRPAGRAGAGGPGRRGRRRRRGAGAGESSCTAPSPRGRRAAGRRRGVARAGPRRRARRGAVRPHRRRAPRPRPCVACAASGSTARWPAPARARATRSPSAP